MFKFLLFVLVCKINFVLKLGFYNIGVFIRFCLSCLKVWLCLIVYFIWFGWFFLVKFDNGVDLVEKLGMNFL